VARFLYRMGRWIAGHRLLVILVWVVAAVGVAVLVSRVGADTSNDLTLPGTGSQSATDLLAAQFPPQQNGANPVVFQAPDGKKATEGAYRTAVAQSVTAMRAVPHVYSVTSPFSQQGQAQVSKDQTIVFAQVLMDVSSADLTEDESQAVLDAAAPAKKAGMAVAVGGSIGSELSKPATESSEVVGIVVAMIILSLTFGSLAAMGMPIITAIIGLVLGLGLVGLLGHVAQVPTIAPTLATMIGLGVGIDYALFLVTRHRQFMKEGFSPKESVARALATSGSAIVFAGTTVVIALIALAVAGIPLVTSLGYSSALAVATAVLAAVTLMPALLSLLGRHITSLALPSFLRPKPKPEGAGFWDRFARFVTTKPWRSVLIGLLILIPLVIPFFTLTLGQEDIGATPTDTQERQAYDLMTEGFGVGYNGPFLIATSLGTPAKPSAQVQQQENELTALQKQLQAEQTSLTAQANQLQAQANQLQAQANQLKAQQAALESQAASLQEQASRLQAQRDSLQAQAASLQRQAAALEAQAQGRRAERERLRQQASALLQQAEGLVRHAVALRARQAANQADQRRIQSAITATRVPARRRLLGARLARLQAEGRRLQADLAATQAQGQSLRRQAQRLRTQAETLRAARPDLVAQAQSLRNQAASLASQAAGLERQRASLAAQAAQLDRQANQLQQQAASLQAQQQSLEQQQASLEAQQAQAQQQKAQAESLKSQLTKELTKAGGDDRGTDPRLVSIQNAVAATPGIALMSPPKINKSGTAAVYSAIPTTPPAAVATADLVGTLRDSVLPKATAGSNVTVYVGGTTAQNVDLASAISSRLFLVILTVLALCFLVLLLAFRSVLVPLQAVLTNVICVAASFGVLTAVFQWGWGISLVGIDTARDTVPIASYVPLMMFAVLFGLSMDYQVFMLSQVAQHRAEGDDDRKAVTSGLAVSSKVITAAALIMIGVFGSFILNGDPTVKQFGVGLAVAVALAGSMVMLLAPAVLVLLRKTAWWVPGWMDRILPHIDIEGRDILTARDAEFATPDGAPSPSEVGATLPEIAVPDGDGRPAAADGTGDGGRPERAPERAKEDVEG
jgi:uncharacterized membrane protein YdfJ with MMPL/SSD domain